MGRLLLIRHRAGAACTVRIPLGGSVAKGTPAGRATAAVVDTAVVAVAPAAFGAAACCCVTALPMLNRTSSHLRCCKETNRCHCHCPHALVRDTVCRGCDRCLYKLTASLKHMNLSAAPCVMVDITAVTAHMARRHASSTDVQQYTAAVHAAVMSAMHAIKWRCQGTDGNCSTHMVQAVHVRFL
mgnify:CR=1 FL=1